MDDDAKDFRRGKPHQKLYTPGSGPLRKSNQCLDNIKMDRCKNDNDQRSKEVDYPVEVSSGPKQQNILTNSSKSRKPEQQLYIPKSGGSYGDLDKQGSSNNTDFSSLPYDRRTSGKNNANGNTGSFSRTGNSRRERRNHSDHKYNRKYRQVSEPRSMSPTHSHKESSMDRNRDSRSMETSAGRHNAFSGGGKPPSGRRNSSGYPSESSGPKHPINLDNLPPRFRKKFLAESGHKSLDSNDYNKDRYSPHLPPPTNYNPNVVYNPATTWSQTLPSRGRGRLRDFDGADREKLVEAYMRSYDAQNSRHSTSSSSCTNLYVSHNYDNKEFHINHPAVNANPGSSAYDIKNGGNVFSNDNIHDRNNEPKEPEPSSQDTKKVDLQDSHCEDEVVEETASTNLLDITNLDWTEEVEKNIKLDDFYESSTSSPTAKPSFVPDVKPVEVQGSKRSGKSRRRDKRSSSRSNKGGGGGGGGGGASVSSGGGGCGGSKNSNNNQQPQKSERNRRDSGQFEPGFGRNKERERRDSHRSNVSSNIGNSRDDLDRWRSLRSFSREHSTERRIVSQSNSRDTSVNRAKSPRPNDGFKVPAPPVNQNSGRSSGNQRNSGGRAGGRMPSSERGRVSPAPSASGGGGGGGSGAGGGSGGGGGSEGGSGRNRRANRRRVRNTENNLPSSSTNWREEIMESKRHHNDRPHDSNKGRSLDKITAHNGPSNLPGVLILPQNTHIDGRGNPSQMHNNPSKPLQISPGKEDIRMMDRGSLDLCPIRSSVGYESGDAARAAKHLSLLQEVDRNDAVLHAHMLRGPLPLVDHWNDVLETRKNLQNALQRLLTTDLKFCQSDNVEHHFWKILYYKFIELFRTGLPHIKPEDKHKVIGLINTIIEEGNVFFESLIHTLEKTYKFSIESYINDNHAIPPKGLGYVGLALISVQKIFLFLGDLARYKEQVNETNNYAKSKLWYTKAQQINPKNGRPYNQLALLAIYARRKLDAVYYYMRSLMSSNPFNSARESLHTLFDENRKKYEAAERKRRAARDAAAGSDSSASSSGCAPGTTGRGLRREVWYRPTGSRTTTLRHDTRDQHLANMTPVELNKNFITSYLHVHGKLITKIGMETFHDGATLMLKQFRALLHQQPLPTPSARLLQLTALNIFAVESSTGNTKDGSGCREDGERSASLECALGVSLLMFGALLERCCDLLPEPVNTQQHSDALLLLPAVKVWSDWMLCHSSVWNPPPSLDNFKLGIENDPWDWLAKFMNTLEALDDKTLIFEQEPKEGYVPVRLPEDSVLAGFTPLMYMEPTSAFLHVAHPLAPHLVEHALRMRKLLFFGTEYLVGVEPQVLRLECPPGEPPLYTSAVQRSTSRRSPHDDPLHELSEDSEGEETTSTSTSAALSVAMEADNTDEATRRLLRRKEQLEVRQANMERRKLRMQEMLRGGWVSAEIEVRPRWLVPDTNCFIDHLSLLQRVTEAEGLPYLLAVPLVVVTELEGLRRCARVGPAATAALDWLNTGVPGVKYITSRGTLMATSAFTAECATPRATNDDRVLAAGLSLQTNLNDDAESTNVEVSKERCVREVVLLTDDRNLRVKALAADLPARDLPVFLKWAALTPKTTV